MRNKFLGIGAILALSTFASAQLVLDQITGASPANVLFPASSQDFGSEFNGFDINLIEDFTVTAAETNIVLVEAVMGGWNGFINANFTNGAVAGYNIDFYTSVAAAGAILVGDAASVFVLPGGAKVSPPLNGWDYRDSLIQIPINVNLPGAGTYWFGIWPVMNFIPFGQTGVNLWNSGTFAGGDNAWQANPNGRWNFPGGLNPRNADAAYRVTAVPEPTSMIALAIGAAMLVARQRRKKVA